MEKRDHTMKYLLFLHLWLVVLAVPASPLVDSAAEIQKKVLAVEHSRTEALVHSDVKALERNMADNVTYVHASGKVDTKRSYLDAIRSGQLHYLVWRPRNLQVRVVGTSAVINGEYAVRVINSRVQPAPFDIDIFVLTMYAKRGDSWQQIAWQSTRNPTNPAK